MMLAWSAFGVYVVVTLWLAWLGSRRTTDLRSFALGDGAMRPWVAGLALAASMTSTATFVINPGIVYAYGLPAVLGYGVAAGLGLSVGIIVLSKGFRRFGVDDPALGVPLTVPQWIGRRWTRPGETGRHLTVFYALVNLLLVAMVVLICYAMAGLLVATLRLGDLVAYPFEVALGVVIVFVFSYISFGGTFAHAYTNAAQGLMMLVVATTLVLSGLGLWSGGGPGDPGFFERLAAVDPGLVGVVDPESLLFRNLFEVFGVNLLIGVALACQPHFLIKALYVETERQVNAYLAIAVGAGVLFNSVLLCGLYARLDDGAVAAAVAAQGLGIDGVMPAYIVTTFSEPVAVLISIALLAAGMSTLDGILVALSTILANDVVLSLQGRDATDPSASRLAFRVGRWALVGLGLLSFVLALVQHRTKELSIALFAQEGVYALLVATFVPVVFGILPRRWTVGLSTPVVLAASIVALVVHFTFRYAHLTLLTAADHTNPGLTAAYGLLASLGTVAVGWAVGRATSRN